MDIIFMNSKNSRTSEPHVLILKLTDKLDLRRGEKSIGLWITVFKTIQDYFEYISKKHG